VISVAGFGRHAVSWSGGACALIVTIWDLRGVPA
jgi:hypothetical protein